MQSNELFPHVVFRLGPVEVTNTVLNSLVVSAILIGLALAVRMLIARRLSGWQLAAEFLMEHLEAILRDMSGGDPRPYTPLVVTLALFIGVANLLGLLPGLRAPTADLSTTTALAVVVFLSVPFYGIRARGVRGYLRHYLRPSPLLLPVEVITEFSRTLALAVRLFGNVMSEELVIAVLASIAAILVPVPMMLLAVLTGVVQAYIFSVLTVVYLSAAVRAEQAPK
ncbi:MAG TPA: F0F1 ATP synthase subunit A [Pirellulales bacterium]|nr:F0F1 ATP synthase subunit A [Pirellulales bacterium]